MIPDFTALYTNIVTDEYSRSQLDKVVAKLKENGDKGICTLFHCTAGKDRTGIVSMALLKSYGVGDKEIIRDYMRTRSTSGRLPKQEPQCFLAHHQEMHRRKTADQELESCQNSL